MVCRGNTSSTPSLPLSLSPFIYLSLPSPLSLPSSLWHFRFSEVKMVTLSAGWSEEAITLAHPPFLSLSLPSPLSLPSSLCHLRVSEVKIVTLFARWSAEVISLTHPPFLLPSFSPSLPLSCMWNKSLEPATRAQLTTAAFHPNKDVPIRY